MVDPLTPAELQAKAPELWAWANGFGSNFRHVQEKGEVFLRELREHFSRNILKRVLEAASKTTPGICGDFSVVSNALDSLDTDSLYAIRRDFAGTPSGKVPRWKEPQDWMNEVGLTHLRMLSSGAGLDGSTYLTAHGKRVRVVNGRTLPMSKVRAEYISELPKTTPDDYVICAAADSSAGLPSIMPTGGPWIVRPTSIAEWLTVEEALGRGIL